MTITTFSDIRKAWLQEKRDHQYKLFIDGNWVDSASGKTFTCVDPYSLQAWGRIPEAGADDVNKAVSAARRMFDNGGWPQMPQMPPIRRAALLAELGRQVESRLEEITQTLVFENGKTITEMRAMTQSFANDCRYFGAMAETLHGHTVTPSIPGYTAYTLREPLGVVAAITLWNTPLGLLGWKLLPALAAGNTVIIKPSEVTPVSTLILGELIKTAGFPDGVVNIVTGDGATGEALVRHPDVDKIAFTGSTATGAAIGKIAPERHARVSLELGGKSPNIIFDDANLDKAVDGVIAGIFGASGQACNAGSRVLVQNSIYDLFVDKLIAAAGRLKRGDPLDPSTQFGPLAFRSQFDKVCSLSRHRQERRRESTVRRRRFGCEWLVRRTNHLRRR